MNYQLPRTFDRRGCRIRSEEKLVYEAASVILGALQRKRRYAAAGGIHIPHKFLMDHLDQDEALVTRVMAQCRMVRDTDGTWNWKRGVRKLSDVTDLNALGDTLVTLVDFHRPI